MSDYNLTLFETCELLNRSKKSISRYIRRGLLHPQEIKSQQGTLEYRFSKADLEAFKLQETQNKTSPPLYLHRVENNDKCMVQIIVIGIMLGGILLVLGIFALLKYLAR